MRLISAPDMAASALRLFLPAGESRWKRAAQTDTIIRTIAAQHGFHRELVAASRHLTRRCCCDCANVALIPSVEAIAQVDWGR